MLKENAIEGVPTEGVKRRDGKGREVLKGNSHNWTLGWVEFRRAVLGFGSGTCPNKDTIGADSDKY